jgi:enoyl reductase-like protein
MRMRLIYNGIELTSPAGVPLSQIAVANGLPDPEEASFTEVVDAFRRLGYNTISIVIVKPGRVGRVSALRHA